MKQSNATVLDALGNPTRREILVMLVQGPMVVGEIARRLPISRPAVSKHLRIMKDARLIKSQPHGTQSIIELEATGFEDAAHWLDQFWNEALMNFKLLAENTTEKNASQGQGEGRAKR